MLQNIIECYPDEGFVVLDGLDAAIIGVDTKDMKLIYSVARILDILMGQGMTDEEAFDYYGYNIECLYAGEQTPIMCYDLLEPLTD